VSVAGLVAEHGSPLWLVDLDRVRERLRAFRSAWLAAWPDVEIAYPYRANRLPALLRAVAAEGAGHQVAGEAEYGLARRVAGAPGEAILVDGPAKSPALLERAARDGALVIADSGADVERAAAAGVRRLGLRVGVPGAGIGVSRFGVPPAEVPAVIRRAAAVGRAVRVLAAHLVSTGFARPLTEHSRLATTVTIEWPLPTARFVATARALATLAVRVRAVAVDLGGSFPAAPAVRGHARAVAGALGGAGFDGRLILEPGRAIVGDAVDLACTVRAVKRLADGTRCVIADAGTNLVPGALWRWPRIEAAAGGDGAGPALVAGPLNLASDVLHPAADLPAVDVGDLLLVRGVGAYQQVVGPGSGEPRPATVALDHGRWRLAERRATLDDLLAGDVADPAAAGARGQEEEP
jgi:diaminopimelate decarboxylase